MPEVFLWTSSIEINLPLNHEKKSIHCLMYRQHSSLSHSKNNKFKIGMGANKNQTKYLPQTTCSLEILHRTDENIEYEACFFIYKYAAAKFNFSHFSFVWLSLFLSHCSVCDILSCVSHKTSTTSESSNKAKLIEIIQWNKWQRQWVSLRSTREGGRQFRVDTSCVCLCLCIKWIHTQQ